MLNKEILNEVVEFLNKDTDRTEELLNNVVTDITYFLDNLLTEIDTNIVCVDCPSVEVVEKYMLRLSSCLFSIQDSVEKLGVEEITSKIKAQEKYNNEYLAYQTLSLAEGKKATVKELEAKAESNSLHENTVSEVYNRAYKLVKSKVASAEDMLHILSKMYSYRIEMTKITGKLPGKQILNEGV